MSYLGSDNSNITSECITLFGAKNEKCDCSFSARI
jgi:hypothetical protein